MTTLTEAMLRRTTPSRRDRATSYLLLGLIVAVSIVLLLTFPDRSPSAISGTVTCSSGNAVVGIWVEAHTGASGWADFKPAADRATVRYNYRLRYGGAYVLHIGCGGTSVDWKTSNRTTKTTDAGRDFLCSDDALGAKEEGLCR